MARPMAQGQAMISTATALTSPKVSAGSGPKISQTPKVRTASAMTTGTKTIVTLSTMACIGSLPPWASSTMRMICASIVSRPTAVARKVKLPVWFTVPRHNRRADALGHRHGFARNHALVDIARAVQHLAVDGQALTRSDLDHISKGNLGHVYLGERLLTPDPRATWRQPHQPLDRLRRAALRPRLHPSADEDQRHDHRGGLVIDVDRARGQHARGEGCDHGKQIRCRRADRDEAVHVRRALQQRGHTLEIKRSAWPNQHRRRQRKLDQPAFLHANSAHDQMVHARDKMAAHLQHENRQCKKARHGDTPLQLARLFISLGHLIRPSFVPRQHPGRLALGADGGDEIINGRRSGDQGLLGRQVDIGRRDTGHGR